jgi:hypothetical protein
MTTHRLIRCTLDHLLQHAGRLDPVAAEPVTDGTDFPHWRYGPDAPGDRVARGRTRWPDGSVVTWCLELEPGANGVLAHLSADAAAGPLHRLPRPLCRLALRSWSGRHLTRLARAAEATATRQHA